MHEIHKHGEGINGPLKGNCFYRCAACMQSNPKKMNRGPSESQKHKRSRTKKKFKNTQNLQPDSPSDDIDDLDDIYIKNATPGQFFHMDFGFVRGSNY